MADSKYFGTTKRGEIPELRTELLSDKRKDQVAAMKKIIANMSLGNDMSQLFPDVLTHMQSPSLELKKMVYHYIVTYSKMKAELALLTVNSFIRDAEDSNPLFRGLAIRTMSYIPVDKITEALCEPLRKCLKDADPYVRKTAALCVAKLYEHSRSLMEEQGFVEQLKDMIMDPNPNVVANVLAALTDINSHADTDIPLQFTFATVRALLTALNDCTEWAQTYILEALTAYEPQDSTEAETMAQLVGPRLAHASSSVVLSSIKLIMHIMPRFSSEEVRRAYCKKMTPPLATLLHSDMPEVQYVALRNVLLLIQKRPDILERELKVFFCEYNDPIYVKLAKLEVMMRIVNEHNVEQILAELKEYSSEVDVDFVRKAVRAIGICAVRIERAAERCIEVLLELIQTKVNYVVQEAIVVIKDIFRKYPNRYESIIATLCENLDTLDEPEAKASMIWIIGQYADRIDNAAELMEIFLKSFLEEPVDVQLALLTATVKLFLRRPTESEALIKQLFKWATEEVDNPDVRDRGYVYWRLLSADPVAARAIVLSDRAIATTGTYDNLEPALLDELICHIGSLAAVYHKPPSAFLAANKKSQTRTLSSTQEEPANIATQNIIGANAEDSSYAGPGVSVAAGPAVMDLLEIDNFDPLSASDSDAHVNNLNGTSFSSTSSSFATTQSSQFGGGSSGVSSLTDSLGGLSFGVGATTAGLGADIFGADQQRLVLPKRVLLAAAQGKGLEVHGTFARRMGGIFLDLTLTNRAMQAMGEFAIQFNSNSFGLTPSSMLDIRNPLMPQQSIEVSLPLVTSGQVVPRQPIDNLQIALKNNIDVFYFQTSIPLHVLFPEEKPIERSDYLRMWRELPDEIEYRSRVDGLHYTSVELIRNKLQLNNVMTVAERQLEATTFLYCASRILPDRAMFLVEVEIEPSFQACNLSIKSNVAALIPLVADTLSAILRHGQ